jgi:hypothetical protein
MFFDPEADASQCAIKLSPQPISPEECSFRLTCVSIRPVLTFLKFQPFIRILSICQEGVLCFVKPH